MKNHHQDRSHFRNTMVLREAPSGFFFCAQVSVSLTKSSSHSRGEPKKSKIVLVHFNSLDKSDE